MSTARVVGSVRSAMLALAIVAAAACSPFRRGGSGNPPAVLYFTNESLDQADIYAVSTAGQPVRIGTVFAGRTDTLVVPADIAARADNVNLVARLLARSATPSSGPIPIRPGNRFQVRLPVDQRTIVVLPAEP
jgi:hypothetical protein